MDEFLAEGGEIKEIPQGQSGHERFQGQQRPIHQLFDQPKQERTPIPEVIAALDERKKPKAKKPAAKTKSEPKLKTIYDDFGEPIRRVWVEE